jgi:anti-sigma-K factor RskA
MTAPHEPFDELAAVYAVGALDGEDLARFRAHLRTGCAGCERVVREYQETLVSAAAELEVIPPAHLKRALLARLPGRPAAARPRLRLGAVASMALAAGLAALAVGAALRARYETRLASLARETQALREALTAERELAALVGDPATRFVQLAGLAPSPQAEGRVIWNERRGGVFVATALPPAPADKVYELWAIAGGTPRPAGVFRVDEKGEGRMKLAALPGAPAVQQFAVTLEPAGGVPAPTGAMYLASAPS